MLLCWCCTVLLRLWHGGVCAGEDHPYCVALIEAHKACLRTEGFKVGNLMMNIHCKFVKNSVVGISGYRAYNPSVHLD